MSKRVRKEFAELIKKYSPIKKNVKVEDEDELYENYNKIMPKIWLGNYKAAKDKDFFKKHNIKAVLNCTKDLPNTFCSNEKIEYMRIPVDDSLKEVDYKKMLEYFPIIVDFIHKHTVLQNSNILIHCFAGRQRSAGAVAAFLMMKFELKPEEAVDFITSRRREAFHFGKSINFDWSMHKYRKQLDTKNKKQT